VWGAEWACAAGKGSYDHCAGPVGPASLITTKLYSPSLLVASTEKRRLAVTKKFMVRHTVNPTVVDVAKAVRPLTKRGDVRRSDPGRGSRDI
jgi:threonine dehydrogenase-like Zn-dependent dehydrogenase